MILLNLCVIIDYFIIPLNDLASSIALLAFLERLPLNILTRYFLYCSSDKRRREDENLDQLFHFRTPICRLWDFKKQVIAVTLLA